MSFLSAKFLSIQAQDFIEEPVPIHPRRMGASQFLSIQAQDFIED